MSALFGLAEPFSSTPSEGDLAKRTRNTLNLQYQCSTGPRGPVFSLPATSPGRIRCASQNARMASSQMLFSRGSLRDTLEATLARVDEEVDGAPEDHLLHADVEEWVKAIVALRGMRTPTLGEPWMDDAEEIRIDLSRTASGIFGRAPFLLLQRSSRRASSPVSMILDM